MLEAFNACHTSLPSESSEKANSGHAGLFFYRYLHTALYFQFNMNYFLTSYKGSNATVAKGPPPPCRAAAIA